jgi:hypothetical protein
MSEVFFGEEFPGNAEFEHVEYEKRILELEEQLQSNSAQFKIEFRRQQEAFDSEIAHVREELREESTKYLELKRRIAENNKKYREQVATKVDELKKLRQSYSEATDELLDRDDEAEHFRKVIGELETQSVEAIQRLWAQLYAAERRWVIAIAGLKLIFKLISKGFISVNAPNVSQTNILNALKQWVGVPPLPITQDTEEDPFHDPEKFLKKLFNVGSSMVMQFRLPPPDVDATDVDATGGNLAFKDETTTDYPF